MAQIEYLLGMSESKKYPVLKPADDSDFIVTSLTMLGFGDCIDFRTLLGGSELSSNFGLYDVGCFRELTSYTRFQDMPLEDLDKLGARVYERLFVGCRSNKTYEIEPEFDRDDVRYNQILDELRVLHDTQKRLVSSGEIVFPDVSDEELAWIELW